MQQTTQRALVLSGGGGRGAAIAGVRPPAQLRDLWAAMVTENVQMLSPELPPLERVALRVLLKELLTSEPDGGGGLTPRPAPSAATDYADP